jgi:phosphoserine phosphatase
VNQTDLLPSWKDRDAKQRLIDLLDHVDDIEPERRVAVFDNDGTLWCEKPNYSQVDFFVAVLAERTAQTPELGERPEYRALLDGDAGAVAAMGVERVTLALVELFDGLTSDEYRERAVRFFDEAVHSSGRSYRSLVYAPMLELLDVLREVGIEPFIVSGGGNEFVRAVCAELYGIPPWHVVGSTVVHEVETEGGAIVARRTAEILGEPNEGEAKISNIALHIGVRPILAVGNSSGDAAMLEFTSSGGPPGLSMIIDHDDAEREYAYRSEAATFEAEPVNDTASRLGWTVVSMSNDWTGIFA